MPEKILAQGAEAILIKQGGVVNKKRISKSYRHPELDKEIIKLRTRHESRILEKAGKEIFVPKIKKVGSNNIEMEFIDGKKLSEFLECFNKSEQKKILKQFGRNLALLHNSGIIHNDLTTSNMIWSSHKKKLYFIDFGLSFHSNHIEDKAVDLHLLKQALESKHSKNYDFYLREIFFAYKKLVNDSEKIFNRLKKVELRGRYKHKRNSK